MIIAVGLDVGEVVEWEPRKVKQFLQGHIAKSWVATAFLARARLQHCATVPRRERAGLLSQGLLNECKWLRKMMVEKNPINLSRDNFSECDKSLKNINYRTSLVFQWLGIHLAMQRTLAQSLVGELSSTCHGAVKPMCHNGRAHRPQWKIPHDAMKVPGATTKTRCSQINIFLKNSFCPPFIPLL